MYLNIQNLVGQTLGRYQIVNLLGEGGMGAVYRGRDATLQRDVAIKVMHPQFARQTDFRDRFLQEARTAARLDHPGIVKVFDFGSDQARSLLYIIMEFIPGANLRQMLQNLLRDKQWLLLPEALQLIRQVCLAVDYAHRQGVLHRDLKPDNVMLKSEPSEGLPYRPVLTDLGLAKLAEGGLLTQEGTSMGTPAYMSPEQALGQPTDPRSDVYSLGILLYELVVGRLPFPVKTITQAIHYHTKEPPPSPRSLRPDLPEHIERVILKALEKEPDARFSDAGIMAKALVETISALPAGVTASPTALAGAVSLLTQYQQSLVEVRGPSILQEFPQPTTAPSQDRLQVMAPGGAARSVAMKPGGLTIGRDADNDIALEDPKVSRHHARIEFDGLNYKIFDLDSSNGTYLANVKLLAGVPEIWTPEKVLRVGNHWLRLLRSQGAGGGTSISGVGTQIEPSLVRSSPGAGRVGVFMEKTHLVVEPGQSVTAGLIVINQGTVVDHFRVGVAGVPAEWLQLPTRVSELLPGAQREVLLTIQPPRLAQSRAGDYPLTIQVASQDAPDQVAELTVTLTVTLFQQFNSELRPERIRANQAAQVIVENQGNTPQNFNLRWQDRADELAFEPLQGRLAVAAGETGRAQFRAKPRQRHWIGGARVHPISIQVSNLEGQVQSYTGEVVSGGLISVWLPPLLLFLCVVLGAAAAFVYYVSTGEKAAATATAQAGATQTAQAIAAATTTRENEMAATARAATETADALKNANQATLVAATATATWLQQDDDRDGLTNQQEQKLQTLPNDRDTDKDGLDDGVEVGTYMTDPLKADTDGDGLKDGEEVAQGINPLKVDTDGDGESDARDPDPGRQPTPTFTSTPTPTSTAMNTPTPTPIPPDTTTNITQPDNDQNKNGGSSFPELDWVPIPAGNFIMGSSEADIQAVLDDCRPYKGNCQADWFQTERPQRQEFTNAFLITRYEITNAQHNLCVNSGVCSPPREASSDNSVPYNSVFFNDNYPVVTVTAGDANTFCRWVGGRLPTEIEWEKAARGTDGRRYPWGNALDLSRGNLYSQTSSTSVGSYPGGASPYGVMDMTGNVAEFTSDNVVRGGSWKNPPYEGRTTQRSTGPWLTRDFTNFDIGFRCVRE